MKPFFPLYSENILTGPHHVSFTLPGVKSNILNSVGVEGNVNFLIPNSQFLGKVIEGDLGIADNMIKSAIYQNLNSSISSKNENVFKGMAKNFGINIDDINKYKVNGKLTIPMSDIKVGSQFNNVGLKSIEKTFFQSLFETQKPYMEIAKLIIESLADCEDIVARIMPLLSLNPLKAKSHKPIVNNGVKGDRPQALGFGGGLELKKAIAELSKMTKKGGEYKINNDGSVDKTQPKKSEPKKSNSENLDKKWTIISEVYSNGYFDPNIKYDYTYIDLTEDEVAIPEAIEPEVTVDDDLKDKPNNIILGVYDSNGNPIDPVGDMAWVKNSPKWKFTNKYSWSIMGQPTYVWSNGIITKMSDESPGKSWEIKKYKKDEKNIITNDIAIEGDPKITEFKTNDITPWTSYYNDFIKNKIEKNNDLDTNDKIEAVKKVKDNLDIKAQVQNVFNYSQLKSPYNDLPENLKIVYQPYQLNIKGNNIWIDPENDYDLKVIKVLPANSNDKTNSLLLEDKPFSSNYYGHGDESNPQTIDTIYRYANAKEKSYYYIVEGVKRDDGNEDKPQVAKEDDSSKWYKLKHALGIFKKFILFIIKVVSKIIPSLNKLIKLFSKPTQFLTDIITDKLKDNVSFLSKEAFETYSSLRKYYDGKQSSLIDKTTKFTNIVEDKAINITNNAQTTATNIANNAQTTATNISNNAQNKANNYSKIVENKATNISNNIQTSATNKYKEVEKLLNKSVLKNYVYVDKYSKHTKIKSILDGKGTIPLSIFGNKFNFGLELNMDNLLNNKTPLKLIFKEILSAFSDDVNKENQKYKEDSNVINTNGNTSSQSSSDSNTNKQNQINYQNSTYETVSVKYSTGVFIPGVKYNYIYLTEDLTKKVNLIEEMANTNDVDEMNNAILESEKLINSNPDNHDLKSKLENLIKKIKSKFIKLLDIVNIQPMIKFLLGLVSFPIQIISGVVKWLIDFFKSLSNPLKLPSKMAEFLSFKWFTNFFAPDKIMGLIGMKFNPGIIKEWTDIVNQPNHFKSIPGLENFVKKHNIKTVEELTAKKSELEQSLNTYYNNTSTKTMNKYNSISKTVDDKVDNVAEKSKIKMNEFFSKISKAPKNIPIHFGNNLLPDSFPIADLNKFFSLPFMASLPTFNALAFKKYPNMAFKTYLPIICFIESLINAIIDFIWSILGLEALIKPPHIKLCSKSDKTKTNNATVTKTNDNVEEIDDSLIDDSTDQYGNKYIWEVKMKSGMVLTFTDKIELDKYIEDNKDKIDFEFN